jgi:hypothetical protein
VVTIGSALRTRKLPCWIESFVEESNGLPSPRIFRLWSAITTIGGALERRVWTASALSAVYANLFVLLVAPPGVGKTMAIRAAIDLWHSTRKLKVAPDDMTKAALIDHMSLARQVHIYSPTDMLEYHSLLMGADELGVLLPAHDLSFMSTMNILYDNRDIFKETRRGREEDLNIINPQATMLAGTQPDFLASLLPPEAWGMGFMSRILMIYHGKAEKVKLFGARMKLNTKDLSDDLKIVAELHGEMTWSDEAEALLVAWHDSGMRPVPTHTKLKHYAPRRILFAIKLAMISAVSRNNSLIVEPYDVQRAQGWLLEIEALMPEVFKDMNGKSDAMIIQDLHHYLWEIWSRDKTKFIHRSRVDMFLGARTPAYNVENIVKLCISIGILKDHGNDLFTPGSINDMGED